MAASRSNSSAKPIPDKWLRLFALIPGYDPVESAAAGDTFDDVIADGAVAFFHERLVFIEGERAGEPFTLEEWQQAIVGCLFGWKRADGMRRYREALVYVPRKNGKALDVDTPIPTPDGWSRMGDLEAGDVVFDECGQPVDVLEAHPVMFGNRCYRVEFSDGSNIVADEEHLWRTRDNWRGVGVRTTKRILETLTGGSRGDRLHSIEVAGPLNTPWTDLPIPPYLLGAWLGDGDSDCSRITAPEAEMVTLLEKYTTVEARVSGGDRRGRHVLGRGSGLQGDLRRLGVLGNKHVPRAYLRANIEQRMDLMRGLMDTDGYVSSAGQCEFTSMSPTLRDNFLELARSLGFKPSLKTARATIDGRDVGEKYRIQFWAWSDNPVFALQRKRDRLRPRPSSRVRSGTRQIVAVTPVDSRPVRCIRVSGDSSLFLAGDGMIPTHNTPFCAGMVCLTMFTDGEPGAQLYSAAAEKEQAGLIYRHAAGMIARNPDLDSRCRIYRTFKSIEHHGTASIYKALSADADTKHGLNSHFVVVDELHAHPNGDLVDVLITSTGSRRQPMIVHITTADFSRESVCNTKYDYACKVRDSVVADSSFMPAIWEAAVEDDWTSPEVWAKANPNLGVSVRREYLERECKRAQDEPSYENTFKRLHLNIRTQQDVRWLKLEQWDDCNGAVSAKELEGRTCYGGLDLSTKLDISAFVLVFPPLLDDEPWKVLPRFWIPGENAHKREKRDRVPYLTWERQGLITLTPGNVIDYDYIKAQILEDAKRFEIKELGYDPFNANQISVQLAGEGIEMVEVRQGFLTLSEPSKELERLVVSKMLAHGGNPVLRWMASHVAIETDAAGNIKPSKKKSTERIDGIAALVTGLARAIVRPMQLKSRYETQGVRFL